jgi:hypothetical protein
MSNETFIQYLKALEKRHYQDDDDDDDDDDDNNNNHVREVLSKQNNRSTNLCN